MEKSTFVIVFLILCRYATKCLPHHDTERCSFLKIIKFMRLHNDLALQDILSITNTPAESMNPIFCGMMPNELALSSDPSFTTRTVSIADLLTKNRTFPLKRDFSSIAILPADIFNSNETSNILKMQLPESLANTCWVIQYSVNCYEDMSTNKVRLLFTDSLLDTIDNMRFDSQIYITVEHLNIIKLFEVYRICPSSVPVFKYVHTFNENVQPIKFDHEFFIWERRKNLQGCQLPATFIPTSSAFHAVRHSNKTSNKSNNYSDALMYSSSVDIDGISYFGTSADVFSTLMAELNFTLQAVIPEKMSYGIYDPSTHRWNGIIGVLAENHAEFSLNDLTVTTTRSEVVQFVAPIYFQYNMLFMKNPSASFSFIAFLGVFYPQYWIVLLAITIFSVFVLVCFTIIYEGRFGNARSRFSEKIGSSFSFMFISALNLDISLVKNSFSSAEHNSAAKIFIITFCIFGYINLVVYEAGLTSSLTVQNINIPIKTLEDLLSNRDYRLIVTRGSSDEAYFSEATKSTDHMAKEVWDVLVKNSPDSFVKNGRMAQEQLLLDGKKVFFASKHDVEIVLSYYPCVINTKSEKYAESQGGFPFRKGSPYQKLFKEKINNMVEHGEWNYARYEAKRRKEKRGCDKEPESGYQPMGYLNVLSLYIAITSGIVSAVFILILEFCIRK